MPSFENSQDTNSIGASITPQPKDLAMQFRGEPATFKSPFTRESIGNPERSFVKIVTCLSPDFDIELLFQERLDQVKYELYHYGAIIVRGLRPDADRFSRLCDLFGTPAEHSELSSVRTRVAEGVYTSTDHPADQSIQLHNEQAYLGYWPRVVSFTCIRKPRSGGQTPIADCRDFGEELPRGLAEHMREEGVLYVRNIGAESSISWMKVFGVRSASELEAYCSSREPVLNSVFEA